MEANIVYCRDIDKYYKLLENRGICDELRLTKSIKNYLNTLIVTEQKFSKRGLKKYVVMSFIDYNLTEEETVDIIKDVDYNADVRIITNSYMTNVSIYSNNLTDMVKSADLVIKKFQSRLLNNSQYNEPKISLSTDLYGSKGISYYCRDLYSTFEAFQIIKLDYQTGEIYLGLNEVHEEMLVLILNSCINTQGRIKIFLDCPEYERLLWIDRVKYILLENNINIDFSILEDIIQRKEF